MKSILSFLNSLQNRPLLGLFALAAGSTYLARAWQACGGHLSPPLDDTYIYLQYARRLAEGYGFSYSGAAAPSTGSTSLLHLLLLVPGWWAGLRGSAYLIVPFTLGISLLGLTLMGMAAAATPAAALQPGRSPRFVPVGVALALTGLCGHLLWASLTGMDTVLFMAGLALVLAFLARGEDPLPPRFWLLLGFLSWLRPEGIVFAGVAWLAGLVHRLRAGRRTPNADTGARPRGALAEWSGPVGAIALLAVPFLLNFALVGSFQSDGMLAKSLFSEPRGEVLQKSLGHLPEIWRRIALLYVTDFGNAERLGSFRSLLTALIAVGAGAGLLLGLAGRRGAAGFTAAAWALLFVTLTAMTVPWYGHNYRYQIPGMVPVALLAAFGWSALIGLLPARLATAAGVAVVSALLLLQAPGAWHMRDVYALNCQNIRDQQEKVGRWIRANTPPDARIGLNDAGAIVYYGERATLDLIGLTTHGWAIRAREGSGALFEQLERLPPAERPTLFALYPTWFRGLTTTRILGRRIFEADLANNTICGYRTKIVYEPDWNVAGSGARPRLPEFAGLVPIDEVDVGDRVSEEAHRYLALERQADLLEELVAPEPDSARVADGGRRVSHRETFRVTLPAGSAHTLVMRTSSREPLSLRVALDATPVGHLAVPPSVGSWREVFLRLPPRPAAGPVDITIERDPPRPMQGHPSFHYWIYP